MEQYTDSLVRLDRHPARASLRAFGCVIALLCFARALVWATHSVGQPAWACALGVIALAIAALQPELLRGLYIVLGVLSYPLRWLAAFSILALFYFALITPVAWLFRLTRSSETGRAGQSAWRECKARHADKADKAEYFRQF
jgi:pimeloyl-ACP methyl ester carboxylesterase